MQDSYYGLPQISLQDLNVPVSALNAFIAAHDNAGAQAALFTGGDIITGGPLDDLFRGYDGADAISTGAGADTLDGGAGDDTLDGGAGGDVIATGAGADVIVVGQGQSAGQADVVTDWSSSDAIHFAHMAGDSSAYVEETAADLGAAAARADQLIGSGAANIVAVAVGNDVAIYADSGADNGVADDVVILSGRTLADVGYSNFGLSAATVTPPAIGSGVDLHGTSAADTLRGGPGDDTIDGGAGGDNIYTGEGSDVVVVGQGQSLLDYGKTDSVMDWSSTDSIRFAHGPSSAGEYVEATTSTWGDAAALANSLIGSGSANVVAVAIGADVAVYADSAGDDGVADDLVVLTGRTLADVSYANVQAAAQPATPPVAVPPPAAPTGLMLDAASDSGVKGDGLTNVAQFRMTGVAEKGASVSLYDGTRLVGTGQADAATGVFSVAATAPLADGTHALSAMATNSGGAGAYSAPVQVTLDSVGPAAPTANLMSTDSATKGDGITNVGLVRMDGVAEKGAAVALYDGAMMIGTATANATTGAYSIQTKAALADGVHVLQVQATDAAGNVGAMSGGSTVVVDTHAGVGAFDAFTETATGQRATVTLHGTAADEPAGVASVNVFQDGSSIGAVKPVDGEWSLTKTNVSNAVHTYTLQVTDAAGNVGAGTSSLILGSTSGDRIVGKATNDIIHGDAGADTLTGGAGADIFVYNALDDAAFGKNKSSSVDTITDFQSGTDRLDLSDLGHMTFKGRSPTVGAHEVSWYVSSGNTFVTGDVTGDGKADFIIQLKGSLALSGSDFLLA